MIDAVLPLEDSRMDQFDSNERKKLLTLFEPHSFALGWCCWHRALMTRSALIWMIYVNFLLFKNLTCHSPGWVDWKKCSSTCKKQRGKRRPRGHNSRPWWVLVWNTNKTPPPTHTHKPLVALVLVAGEHRCGCLGCKRGIIHLKSIIVKSILSL